MSKLIIPIIALGLILFLETLFPLFKDRRGRILHLTRNLGIGILNGLILSLVFAALTALMTARIQERGIGFLSLLTLPFWMEAFVALVLFDLWMYLWHRMNHRAPFLWRFHRMHHSDNQVDASTALRFHTGELIFSSILRLVLIIPILGLSLEQLLLYETLLQPIILFHHSNIALPETIDRFLRMVIVTPNMHRVHHSVENPETNSNYSSIFSFWDRMGNSFRRRNDPLTLRYGLPDFPEPRWQSVIGMLKTPLR